MDKQNIDKPEIVVVWFKRDLRFTDHEALYQAQKQALPILLLYCFEPSVMEYHDSDLRHWRFVHQSLREMNEKLQELEAAKAAVALVIRFIPVLQERSARIGESWRARSARRAGWRRWSRHHRSRRPRWRWRRGC